MKKPHGSLSNIWSRPLVNKAFSIIELLVAMAIASILMLLLVQFIQVATNAVVTGEDSLYRTNDAQATLDMVAADLRSLKLITAPLTSTGTTVSPPEILQAYNDNFNGSQGVALSKTPIVKPQIVTLYPSRLYLLANSAGSDGTGSGFPHLIAYRVVWQDPIPNDAGKEPILALYRDFISQDNTFGYTGTGSSADGQINTAGIAGLTNLYASYWNVNSTFANGLPPVSDLLVGNIIDFQVYFYDVGSATPTVPLNPSSQPSNQYVQASNLGQAAQVDLNANGLFVNQTGFPTGGTVSPYTSLVAEVKITVLTNKGVEIMNSGGLSMTSPNLLNNYARTYVRRVPLNLR